MKKDRLIAALDVESLDEARRFVRLLQKDVTFFKVGLRLFTAAGYDVVRMIHSEGGRVFLDLKFHDIPNTVAQACEAAARLHVAMANVHASGGSAMMQAAAKGWKEGWKKGQGGADSQTLLAVTVLTSDQGEATGRVVDLAQSAQAAGLGGVVCSVHEAAAVRQACGKHFVIVTPGIRLPGEPLNDQKRTATPAEAAQAGADFIVVGRPILEAADPLAAVRAIHRDLGS